MHTKEAEHSHYHSRQSETTEDGIIMWDQHGVVIMWADGHRSRLSWSALRALCTCKECWQQDAAHDDRPIQRNAA